MVFTNPLEIVKIRLQVQGETAQVLKAQGLEVPKARTAVQVVRELGLVGLYRGRSLSYPPTHPLSRSIYLSIYLYVIIHPLC